ncbi:MAG: tetratricopeptide repeat protein [Bryobacteraceae bacterium]
MAASPCLPCHAKEVAGFDKSPMAHSLSRASSCQPGSFTHDLSGTKFVVGPGDGKIRIGMTREGLTASYPVKYIIGSGNHAHGYLVDISSYLFQAPISFYSKRGIWDMAPGYETDPAPDFSRPVTVECLECHAGRPRPVPTTLNRYEVPAFSEEAISCDRCHGAGSAHLKQPSRRNIVNARRLSPRARDSVCEQCHLSGEVRILNPGRQFGDFQPGQELEDVFSVYVRDNRDNGGKPPPDSSIKVIGHAEQLALSACSRSSAGELWCGTCHNPHQKPENPVSFYRDRCLGCHGARILHTHSKPAIDCVSCHMPKRKAKDGAHTVFTDHRIARVYASGISEPQEPVRNLVAWREPAGALATRNLGLANIEIGQREKSAEQLEQGARQAVSAMKSFPEDAVLLTKLGMVLMRAGTPAEAIDLFEYVVRLEPDRAGSHANLGSAYKESGTKDKAIQELERAIQLDPSLEAAYRSLGEIYFEARDIGGVRRTSQQYLLFMPENITARKALRELGNR